MKKVIIVNNTYIKDNFLQKLERFLQEKDNIYFVTLCSKEQYEKEKRKKEKIDFIILSGSELMIEDLEKPQFIDKKILLHEVMKEKNIPILGICFGAQFLNTYFGGSLQRKQKQYCKMTPIKINTKNTKNNNEVIESKKVKFCLRDIIDKLGKKLEPFSMTNIFDTNDIVAAFRHIEKPHIIGFLFHPEANMQGKKLLENIFFSL